MQTSYKKMFGSPCYFLFDKSFRMQIISYESKFWLQKYIIILIIEKFDKRSSR